MTSEIVGNRRSFVLSEEADLKLIRHSLRADIDEGRVGGFVPIINSAGKVVGTITDGDLRKVNFETSTTADVMAKDIMNTDFIFCGEDLSPTDIARAITNQLQKRKIANSFPVSYIPILKKDGTLLSLLHISEVLPSLEEINKQIIVIGQGFVGLTFAMALVESGKTVWAVEKNLDTFKNIKELTPSVFEPQLNDILKKNLNEKYQITAGGIQDFLRSPLFCRRVYVIAVGTPHKGSSTDLSQISEAVDMIIPNLMYGDLVILRSTVPVGTTRNLIGLKIKAKNGMQAGIDYHLAYAPERTVEGNAIAETRKLPQLVAGWTSECTRMAMHFFSGIVGSLVACESLESCELAKLISNAYRDVIFGFANEIASIARVHSIDVNRLISDANTGYNRNAIPQPSPGVGGPCLTKDTYMIQSDASNSVMISARKLNEHMPKYVTELIKSKVEIFGKDILVIGLAFKGFPATNDLRNSPAIEICKHLQDSGLRIRGIDAVASFKEIEIQGIQRYSIDEKDFNPRIISVLNNHEDNVNILKSIVINLEKTANRCIFDPWSILNASDLDESITLKFNLSNEYVTGVKQQ